MQGQMIRPNFPVPAFKTSHQKGGNQTTPLPKQASTTERKRNWPSSSPCRHLENAQNILLCKIYKFAPPPSYCGRSLLKRQYDRLGLCRRKVTFFHFGGRRLRIFAKRTRQGRRFLCMPSLLFSLMIQSSSSEVLRLQLSVLHIMLRIQ